jgi:hypothetical protein
MDTEKIIMALIKQIKLIMLCFSLLFSLLDKEFYGAKKGNYNL